MKKALLLVGIFDVKTFDLQFYKDLDCDLFISIPVVHTFNRYRRSNLEDPKDVVSIYNYFKKHFGERLKGYLFDGNIIDRYIVNGLSIHARVLQFYRLYQLFSTYKEELKGYDIIIRSRMDATFTGEIPNKIDAGKLYIPVYPEHLFSCKYVDMFAYGDYKIMKMYCKTWNRLPLKEMHLQSVSSDKDKSFISDREGDLFYTEYSGEALVEKNVEKFALDIKDVYDLHRVSVKRASGEIIPIV